MLILHVSDIHFRAPQCLKPDTDPDVAIRSRMMQDLETQVRILGKVGAILIGGDVAFQAAPEEYATAWDWIQQLAAISGCPAERIFVVPGNHDVDRGMTKNRMPIRNAQNAVINEPPANREWMLRQQLGDGDAGQHLLRPHSAYNDFAAPLGCQIWPDKPFWHQDIDDLGGGVTLRIYGLTSTLLSGRNGDDDRKESLYLSPMQTVLNPEPNTANLVLVHHPIDWLADGDDVDDDLTARAQFHLFGHKHRQRVTPAADYVRIGAGAVNPSRSETPYDPGYNLIELKVEGAGKGRVIRVELHQRKLQKNPELFVPIKTREGADVFVSAIPLPETPEIPKPGSFAPVNAVAASGDTPIQMAGEDGGMVPDAEAAMGDADTRDLLFRFWQLASSERRDIATSLGLLEDGEIELPEPERYGRALIRAGERGIMNKVAAEVARLEK